MTTKQTPKNRGNWRLSRLKELEKKSAAFLKQIPDRRNFTSKDNYSYAVEGAQSSIRQYKSLQKRIAKLKSELGSKYTKRNQLAFANLLFDPLPGLSGADKLKIRNPQYVEEYDPEGETALALQRGANERAKFEWGPGGQKSSSEQYEAAGLNTDGTERKEPISKEESTVSAKKSIPKALQVKQTPFTKFELAGKRQASGKNSLALQKYLRKKRLRNRELLAAGG